MSLDLPKHIIEHAILGVHSGAAFGGFANPSASVGLSAVNGVATTAMRSDAAPALDQGIAPTFTGVHTHSARPVFNAGIDLGTSGIVDSHVADGAGAISILGKPTTSLTSGKGRYYFVLQKPDGTNLLAIKTDGTVDMGSGLVTSGGGLLNINTSTTDNLGISFVPSFIGAGETIHDYSSAVTGAFFQPIGATGATYLNQIGGTFVGLYSGVPSSVDTVQAGLFVLRRGSSSGSITDFYGINVVHNHAFAKGTNTAVTGIRLEGNTQLGTTRRGLRIEEHTGGTTNQEIFLDGAGGIWFRDPQLNIESTNDGDLDITADVGIDHNIGANSEWRVAALLSTLRDGHNVAVGTGTGTKIGTATTQLLGFWNAAPVARPSAYTQTYSTADKTLGAYTADAESAAYTGIDNTQAGTVYAAVADLNALRVAYENLRAFAEDVAQVVNALVDDQQAIGLVG